jgi:hypothetical protein
MISACPNINGNTRRDFADAYRALNDAIHAIQRASSEVFANVADGRNYQTLGPDRNDLHAADRARLRADFAKAAELLEGIANDIADAANNTGVAA